MKKLFSWSQNKRLSNQSLIYILSSGLNGVMSYALLIYLTSNISPYGYGIIDLAVTVSAFTTMVCIFGGNTLIKQSSWLVVETAISNSRFQNSSSFKDVFLKLTCMGFELVSIRVSKDYLDHCDLAFINTSKSK